MVSVSQREQLASTPELLLPKETEQSRQSKAGGERVKVREREIRARARREEDRLHSEKKGVPKKEREGKQEEPPSNK